MRPGPALQPLPLALAMAACVALGMGAARLWWEGEGRLPQSASAPGATDPLVTAPAPTPPARGQADPFRPAETPSGPTTPPADPFATREEPSSPSEDAAAAPQPPPLPPLPSENAPAASGTVADADQEGALQTAAVGQLKGLYSSLSRQDFVAARGYFSPRVADQFDPAFFRQFSRVEVERLEPVGRSTTTLTLRGVVRFAYPDGTSQLESRSFTFSTLDNPPQMISSAFGAVLQPRSAGAR